MSLKVENLGSAWMVYPFACALVVIGAKCWMISHYASPTPFWDQWDAEGAFLYPKYFDGTLSFSDLITPHNEHRVLVSRLWSLLLLESEGYWDPMLQMVANTLILGAAVALFIAAFRPILDRRSWLVFALFSTVIFSLPFSWENTLAGFHSAWHFLLLFSISGLVVISDAEALTPRWWLAVLLLILSYFSIAGGALTMAAAFAVGMVQFVVGRRSGLRELLALAILVAVTVVMVLNTPVIALHAPLKAHSVAQFLQALLAIMSWPATTGVTFIVAVIVCAALIYAPACLMSIEVIKQRPPLSDRRWLVVALLGWVGMQAFTVAYGRAAGATSSRYLDVFAIGLLLNAACLLYLVNTHPALRLQQRLTIGAIVVWLLPVFVGATLLTVKYSLPEMLVKRASGRAETENLRSYLDTGNIHVLQNKAYLDIPYPDPQRLAMIVATPVVRALLPPALIGQASASHAQQRGLARYTGRAVEAVKEYALRWAALLIAAGVGFFALGLAVCRSAGPLLEVRRT
jgi:hypothetical protein